MDPDTVHERPAKRVKKDEAGGALNPLPTSHDNEDFEAEEAGFISDSGAAHGSDLYLDTV